MADFANRTGTEQLDWLEKALAESVHTDLNDLENTSLIPRPRLTRELSEPAAAGDAVMASLRLGCGWLVEAQRLFESRDTYNFDQFFGALDGETLHELALAADALGRTGDAAAWLARARRSGGIGAAEIERPSPS